MAPSENRVRGPDSPARRDLSSIEVTPAELPIQHRASVVGTFGMRLEDRMPGSPAITLALIITWDMAQLVSLYLVPAERCVEMNCRRLATSSGRVTISVAPEAAPRLASGYSAAAIAA